MSLEIFLALAAGLLAGGAMAWIVAGGRGRTREAELRARSEQLATDLTQRSSALADAQSQIAAAQAQREASQREQSERDAAKRMDAKITVLESSHVPMLSQPQAVLEVIREAARAVAAKRA